MYFPFLFFYVGTVEFIRFDTDYSPDYYTDYYPERCFLLFCFLSNFFHLYRKPIFSFWFSLIRNDSIISVTAIQYGWIYTIYTLLLSFSHAIINTQRFDSLFFILVYEWKQKNILYEIMLLWSGFHLSRFEIIRIQISFFFFFILPLS